MERKSNWRSFGHGFMLAGLPMLAFAGADYLFAPPSESTRPPAINRDVSTVSPVPERMVSFGAPALVSAVDEKDVTSKVQEALHGGDQSPTVKTEVADPRLKLVAAIQGELRRVGCYTGSTNGSWTGPTRLAMQAFNDSVRVNIGTDQPDYILLTLLRGHSGKACSRSCDGVLNAPAQCIDRTIEARHIPSATDATRQEVVKRIKKAAPSTATAPASLAPTWSMAASRAPGPETVAPQEEAPGVRKKADPLPGRMAMGAPPAEVPQASASVATAEPEPAPEPVRRVVRARSAPVARSSNSTRSRGSRVSRTFIEISRSAP